MTDLLHRLNFVYKKSKLVPAKADAKKQEQFLEDLKNIRENKGENDPILYMDGVHPQHNTLLAYGWIKKGKDNMIKSNTGRQRININGALDAETHDVIVREDESINAHSTIELLKKIEATYPLAIVIYIICDNQTLLNVLVEYRRYLKLLDELKTEEQEPLIKSLQTKKVITTRRMNQRIKELTIKAAINFEKLEQPEKAARLKNFQRIGYVIFPAQYKANFICKK